MATVDQYRTARGLQTAVTLAMVLYCAGCNLAPWRNVLSKKAHDEELVQQLESPSDAKEQEIGHQDESQVRLTSFLDSGEARDNTLGGDLFDSAGDSELQALPPLEDEQSSLSETSTHFALDPTPGLDLSDTQSPSLFQKIATDHADFYDRDSLGLLMVGLGTGAALANTNADDFVSRDFYQESIRNADTDEYFEAIHSMKIFGEGRYALPIYALAAGGGWVFSETETLVLPAEWGERSLRSVLVGGPPLLFMQWGIGASRPGEADSGSHWEPFQDNNGASGHSFMGAIPFLNAANMTEDPWLRTVYYLGSGMAGLSRVNDDSHYTSQVVLGWWVAYLSARSVRHTQEGSAITPLVQFTPNGESILGFEYHW